MFVVMFTTTTTTTTTTMYCNNTNTNTNNILRRVPRPSNEPTRVDVSPNANLADNVRSLTELWEEYMFGLGDNKPAKDFTSDERNRLLLISTARELRFGGAKSIWLIVDSLSRLPTRRSLTSMALIGSLHYQISSGETKKTPIYSMLASSACVQG